MKIFVQTALGNKRFSRAMWVTCFVFLTCATIARLNLFVQFKGSLLFTSVLLCCLSCLLSPKLPFFHPSRFCPNFILLISLTFFGLKKKSTFTLPHYFQGDLIFLFFFFFKWWILSTHLNWVYWLVTLH